jgi:hypothetical protein
VMVMGLCLGSRPSFSDDVDSKLLYIDTPNIQE